MQEIHDSRFRVLFRAQRELTIAIAAQAHLLITTVVEYSSAEPCYL